MLAYDVYLILNYVNWPQAQKYLPYIKKNLGAKRIIVVSSKKILENDLEGCDFLDESSELLETCGISFDAVREFIIKLGGDPKNTGWYLQQFLKLGISRICKKEYYLVWDADTVPLTNLSFFDKDNKPIFNLKREYLEVYFKTIHNLFDIKKSTKESFISEHMMFNVSIVREMLRKIESLDKYIGTFFWQKILNASEMLSPDTRKNDQRYFSEFETYGTYCDIFYPKLYAKRKLRTLRYGVSFLGVDPDDEILNWAANDFDTISFETWNKPINEMEIMVKNPEHRKRMSFADSIRKAFCDGRKNVFKQPFKLETRKFFLNTLLGKTDFDYFFGNSIPYSTNPIYLTIQKLRKFEWFNRQSQRFKRYWKLFTYSF